MVEDYSAPYQNVAFFGVWAFEAEGGKRDAMAVLCDAANRCRDQDMRTPEVFGALDWLARYGCNEKRARAFRNALSLTDPDMRRMAVSGVYDLLARAMRANP